MLGIVARLDIDRFGDRRKRSAHGPMVVDLRGASRADIATAKRTLEDLERAEERAAADAMRELSAVGVTPLIEAQTARRPKDAFPPDYADLWFLYDTVRRRRPERLIEFGAGLSTAVIAKALQDNGAGSLMTIEANEEWAAISRSTLPHELRSRCEILHLPVEEVEYEGVAAFRHGGAPRIAADFVYLDGPALTPERRVAVDAVEMEDGFADDVLIAVDGRLANVAFLIRHLRHHYRVQCDALCFVTDQGGEQIAGNYMTTFERIA